MHVSWKFAEVTDGHSMSYEEMYLATGMYTSPPSDGQASMFAKAVFERVQEMYRLDPQCVVMALVTISRLRGVSDGTQVPSYETPLFDQPPPKVKRDSDVEIDLGPDPSKTPGII